MKEYFEDHNFKPSTLKVIKQADEIINEYQEQGFDLTLRQLYYQFVARDLIPNSQKSYSRLGDIISNARLAGLIDWSAIKDRTRRINNKLHFETPAEAINSIKRWYSIDTRFDQDVYIECWVEKEALVGVVESACRKLDIPCFACRGYVSQTAMYETSQRIFDKLDFHKNAIILHLGDHDPSGIDMTRDIEERLNDTFRTHVEIKRIALNMQQVEELSPPPNPAKLTDSRVGGYIKKYGKSSWELDALEPSYITDLITRYVDMYTDKNKRRKLLNIEAEHKKLLTQCSDKWFEIEKQLRGEEWK